MRTAKPWTLPSQPATLAILLAGGASREMIKTQLRNGHLLRLRHGVYLGASAWPPDAAAQHLMLAYAEATMNPDAVLHQSAALAWGLPSPEPGGWESQPVSVTLPQRRGYRKHVEPAIHHVAALPSEHVVRDAAGYLVTSLPRTAVDLAAGLPLPEALVIPDSAARALCAGFVAEPRRSDYSNPKPVDASRELLADVALQRRRTGLLPAIKLTEPCRESAAESMSAGHFELAGLPRPEYQVKVRTPDGLLFPDCYWPRWRLVGECDGAVKYRDARATVLERKREQTLRDLDYGVVRWLAEEIMFHPAVVVARVQRALESRSIAR